jgi:hypothetical protein
MGLETIVRDELLGISKLSNLEARTHLCGRR